MLGGELRDPVRRDGSRRRVLREGDIITEVNGRRVTSMEEFGKIVSGARKGDYLRLYIVRPRPAVQFFALVKIEQ